jgi:NAD(P)-dependent dehydrogenase (short-subunit alcohol dehydrogenase family)
VVAADIDGARAKQVAEVLQHDARAVEPLELDVSDSRAVDEAIGELSARWGDRFDCLINNAGTDRGSDLARVSDDQWHAVFGVNLHGPMHTSRAFVRHAITHLADRARPGDVVNIGSISAVTVGVGAGAYNASKAALLKLTEVLQTEAREYRWPLRVTGIQPAAMDTPMMDQWGLPSERKMDPAVVAGIVRTAVTLPPEVVLQSATITLRNETFPR